MSRYSVIVNPKKQSMLEQASLFCQFSSDRTSQSLPKVKHYFLQHPLDNSKQTDSIFCVSTLLSQQFYRVLMFEVYTNISQTGLERFYVRRPSCAPAPYLSIMSNKCKKKIAFQSNTINFKEKNTCQCFYTFLVHKYVV